MTLQVSSISELAIGELPSQYDNSTPYLFAELLNTTRGGLIYLIEMMPYNEDKTNTATGVPPISTGAIGEFDYTYTGGYETIYVSENGYTTDGNDSPAHTTYLPLTDNPFQFEASVLNGSEFRGGVPSFGAIRLLNGSGALDYITEYYWSGINVSVYAGDETLTREQFAKVFEGLATKPEFNEDEIIINISDKSSLLDTEFAQNLYGGTGGLDGDDDIAGTTKPQVYGEVTNASPVLVDSANLIYQIHDGSMEAVSAVYDKGVELTSDGDATDITTASVSAGKYKTQLSGGYIKLGSSPSGKVTVDCSGDNVDGYVSKPAQICSRIVQTRLGSKSFSSDEIDQGSFNSVDSAIDVDVGIYISQKTTARTIIDNILNPIHVYWTFSRQGLITCGVIGEPTSPVLELNEDNIEDIDAIETIAPAWRIGLSYSKNWTVQSEDDVAAAASSAHKTFIKEDYRTVTSESRGTRTKTPSAVERSFETLIASEEDALTQLTRLETIYRSKRIRYRVKVLNLLFRVFIGDIISLKVNRYNLNNGKNFLITNVSEDAETNSTTLELWG